MRARMRGNLPGEARGGDRAEAFSARKIGCPPGRRSRGGASESLEGNDGVAGVRTGAVSGSPTSVSRALWAVLPASALVLSACSGGREPVEDAAGVVARGGAEAPSSAVTPAGSVAASGGAAVEAGASATGLPFVSGQQVDHLIRPGETHFQALYQITNGGENAEAYFSWDDSQLILQITGLGHDCDQIYTLPVRGGTPRRVSTGTGRTTCAYFFPGDTKILFSSTHLAGPECPPVPDYSRGYVWPLYDAYDIFVANPDGSDLTQLTATPGYDAEATIGPDGTIIFTSVRDGDLDIYTMAPDGSDVKRLTDDVGYDGGPFFSQDGSRICYRASHPQDEAAIAEYRSLLADGLIRPSQLDIYVMERDGGNKTRLTDNGAANFGPYFHPSGEKVIYASNVDDPRGRNFDLYMVAIATKEIERITMEPTFDGFPMFSRDGRWFVFASNRGAVKEGETNIFLAEWKD